MISQLHQLLLRADPRWSEEGPLRSAGQGAAGHGAAARCRRQDPPPGRRGADRRPGADLPAQEGRQQGTRDAGQVHRDLADSTCTGSAHPARPGCWSRSATSPASRPGHTSRPGTAPPRSTPPPATRSATGSPGPGTGRSTACCTSWPPSNCATRPTGRAYFDRRKADGKTSMEAMRALKRRLSDIVYRQHGQRRGQTLGTGPGGHSGATQDSSAADSNPDIDTSEKSLPGPATQA